MALNNPIHRIIKNRWALSTVVTTLIILVISVLLASVVTYFAINVVSTRVQEESLTLTKQHVWYSADGTQAALMIINTGGRDVVIQKFAIRGQTVGWDDLFYAITNKAVSAQLECDTDIAEGQYNVGSVELTMVNAANALTLKSGYSMILFINSPDSITINDVGLTVSITLNTAQAIYYVETNVQGYDGAGGNQGGGEEEEEAADLTVDQITVWFNTDNNRPLLAFVVTNTGASAITIDGITVNGETNGAIHEYASDDFTPDALEYVADTNGIVGFMTQGVQVPWVAESKIEPGETAIFYVESMIPNFIWGLTADDIGDPVTVVLQIDGALDITQNPTILQAQLG